MNPKLKCTPASIPDFRPMWSLRLPSYAEVLAYHIPSGGQGGPVVRGVGGT